MASNEEVYLLGWLSPTGGSFASITGGGGASWGNRQDANQSNVHTRIWDDLAAAGHLASDLPEAHITWTGTPPPDSAVCILAVGDGSTTPFVRNYVENDGGGDNPTAGVVYFSPQVGDALVYFVATEGTLGDAGANYELIASGSAGILDWGVYRRYPSTGDTGPDDRFDFSLPITGTNVHWILAGWDIGAPGSEPYVVDSGLATVVGQDSVFVSTVHGPASPDAELAGSEGLLDGVGELLVEDTGAHLAGAEGILEGVGALVSEGGGADIAGSQGLVDVGGHLYVVQYPPTPVVPLQNVLGCGQYQILAFTRGLREIVGSLEFSQVDWGRELDGTSSASVTIDGVADTGLLARCCALLGELEPFEHELGIYRRLTNAQGVGTGVFRRVWSGPITRLSFPPGKAILSAFDLSGWLTIRSVHANHNFVSPAADAIDVWIAIVQDAMSVENSAGLYPTPLAPAGMQVERLVAQTDHSYAADVISELARTAIDWTTIDRRMQAGPILPQPAGIPGSGVDLPLLVDESFAGAPEIIVDGLVGGNCWFVNGSGAGSVTLFGEYGPAFAASEDHVARAAAPDYAAIEDRFGRIERTASETRILDQASIDANAKSRYELTKEPFAYITGGSLLPTAAIPIEKIVPGFLARIELERACKPISATMRMKTLSVSATGDGAEHVDLSFEPIGTVI